MSVVLGKTPGELYEGALKGKGGLQEAWMNGKEVWSNAPKENLYLEFLSDSSLGALNYAQFQINTSMITTRGDEVEGLLSNLNIAQINTPGIGTNTQSLLYLYYKQVGSMMYNPVYHFNTLGTLMSAKDVFCFAFYIPENLLNVDFLEFRLEGGYIESGTAIRLINGKTTNSVDIVLENLNCVPYTGSPNLSYFSVGYQGVHCRQGWNYLLIHESEPDGIRLYLNNLLATPNKLDDPSSIVGKHVILNPEVLTVINRHTEGGVRLQDLFIGSFSGEHIYYDIDNFAANLVDYNVKYYRLH